MPTARARTVTVVAFMAAGTACDSTPTAPRSNQPAVVTRVFLTAPTSLAPGTTAQLVVSAQYSDGAIRDATPAARYYSQPDDVIVVSPGGSVMALKPGDATVTACVDPRCDGHEIVAVPRGTFRIVGRVTEAGTSSVPVADARVEADGGPAISTDFRGDYRLYGVPRHARLRVSKPGYITSDRAVDLIDHDHAENVAIAVDGPRLDFAGEYQLSIEAAPECRGRLSDALLMRRYIAAVAQRGTTMEIVLSGARFAAAPSGTYNVVPGRALERGAGLVLSMPSPSSCDHSEPDNRIIEVVDASYLQIWGEVVLSPAGTRMAGVLRGGMFHFQGEECSFSGPVKELGGCNSVVVTLAR